MRQALKPGREFDFLTPDEFVTLSSTIKPEIIRIRAAEQILLNANGAGDDEVYKVPMGMEFAIRRIVLTLAGSANPPADPISGQLLLNAAGKYAYYLRSGELIEYASPIYNNVQQIPGSQTWGDQQGPYIRNGEVFGVGLVGGPASGNLVVYMEGLLSTVPGTAKGKL